MRSNINMEQIYADKIRALAPDLSPTAIGIELEIHQVKVVKIAEKYNIDLPHHVKKKSAEENYNDHIKDILRLHDVHTALSLARKIGISESTLRRIVLMYKEKTGEKIRFKTVKRKPRRTKAQVNGSREEIKIDSSALFMQWVKHPNDNRNALRVL